MTTFLLQAMFWIAGAVAGYLFCDTRWHKRIGNGWLSLRGNEIRIDEQENAWFKLDDVIKAFGVENAKKK